MFKLIEFYEDAQGKSGVFLARMALIISCLWMTACSSPTEKANKYYENGMQLLEKGDLDKARLEFQNALQIKDSLPKALYGLALIAEKKGEADKLYGFLNRVVEQNPKHLDAQIKLGRLLLAAGKMDRAMKISEAALALDKESAAVLALRAGVLLKLDDRQGAVNTANAVLAKDPCNVDALVVLTSERLVAHDESKALEYLDSALQLDERNIALQIVKIQTLERLDRVADAEKVFQTLISYYPDKREFRHALAQFFLIHQRGADAEAVFRGIVAENPADTKAKLDMVRFVGSAKGADAAEQELLAFSQAAPDDNELKFALAGLRQARRDLAGTESILDEILKKSPDGPDAVKAKAMLASVRLALGDKPAGSRLIEEILATDARNEQALLLKAGLEIDERKLDGAIADLRTILRDAPTSASALALLAKAHELAASPELAETHYQQAFDASKHTAAHGLPYAEFLLKRGKTGPAEDVLKEILKTTPNHVQTLTLLARVYLAQGEVENAQSVVDEIRRVGGQEKVAEQIQGVIHAGKQEQDQSIASFKRAYDAAPGDSQPLAALVRSYVQAKKPDEALAFLENVLKTSPDHYGARILLGQLHMSLGHKEQAAQAFLSATEKQPNNPLGYVNLSGLRIRENRLDEADAALAQGLAVAPGNYTLRLSRAGLYELMGRYDEAIGIYEDLYKERPNADVIANNLASLLTDHRTDPTSLSRAYELSQRFKNSAIPNFRDTFGWASYKAGKKGEAAEPLEAAVKLLPELPVLRYHLGVVYMELNRKEDARRELEKAVELAEGKPFAERDRVKEALGKL